MMFETSKHVPKTEKRCRVFKDNSQIDNNASKNFFGSTRSQLIKVSARFFKRAVTLYKL